MSVIETIGLSKRFGKKTAVDKVSFKVETGQVYGFLGPNGSGKTTTIGMIVGTITPTEGYVRLFDSETSADLRHGRQQVGSTLEQPNFYPYMSGFDNLRIVASIKGVGIKEVEAALVNVDMLDRSKGIFKTYSLGMKQRLSLAAALLGDPKLLILDEPSNGLDPEGMLEIRELILKLASSGKTIFISSHLLAEIERICTHVAIIKDGCLLEQGTLEELTGGNPLIKLKAQNTEALLANVKAYPETISVKQEDAYVMAELSHKDPALLNEYLANKGIYLSELIVQNGSLEETFMQVTGNGELSTGEQIK